VSVTGVEHIDVSRKIKKILRRHKTKEEKRTGGILFCASVLRAVVTRHILRELASNFNLTKSLGYNFNDICIP
jgi:hypothetical protein